MAESVVVLVVSVVNETYVDWFSDWFCLTGSNTHNAITIISICITCMHLSPYPVCAYWWVTHTYVILLPAICSYCTLYYMLLFMCRKWAIDQCSLLFYGTLTHWGRVTHICVSDLTSIGSDNGLSPDRRQAIIRTNAGILLIGPSGTNFNEILIKIHIFSFKKMSLKTSSAKRRPFCLDLNVLNKDSSLISYAMDIIYHVIQESAHF